MNTFFAIVHKDEDSAYGVQFPDVPGCFSAADDLDDLVANASEALALHLDGETVPEARGLQDIHADTDVQTALSEEGAFIVAVPLVRLTGRKAKANITVDAGLLQAIDETAESRGVTRSAYLSDLARRDLMGAR